MEAGLLTLIRLNRCHFFVFVMQPVAHIKCNVNNIFNPKGMFESCVDSVAC